MSNVSQTATPPASQGLTLQNSLSCEIIKEGLKTSERIVEKLLQSRLELVKYLYDNPITEAGFKRAKAEEEMIRAVGGYILSANAMMEAMEKELQVIRDKFAKSIWKQQELECALQSKTENETLLLELLAEGAAAR